MTVISAASLRGFRTRHIRLLLMLFLLFVIFSLFVVFHQNSSPDTGISSGYICRECNVILISVDALRKDHLSIFGYSRDTSPNIDYFFREGIQFTNHFSQSTNTLPSHMSLFTSLYPQDHGVMLLTDPPLKKEAVTLAELLKAQGYHTAALYDGSDHLAPMHGFDQGFDTYSPRGWLREDVKHFVSQLLDQDQKFFLFLHPLSPHDPYYAQEEYAQLFVDPNYSGKIVSDPVIYAAMSYVDGSHFFWNAVDYNAPQDIQHLQDLYDAKLRWADSILGDVFDKLRASGRLQNTIVILTADHGEEFQEHGEFLHRQLYDEVIRVPLLIAIPGEKRGIVVSALTQAIDVAPTILDLVDLEQEYGFAGKSMLPLLVGDQAKVHDFVLSQWSNMTAVRTQEWKLITVNGLPEELYNLAKDPSELTNVIHSFPDVVNSLTRDLKEVLGEVKYDYTVPAGLKIPEEQREKLIREGYF